MSCTADNNTTVYSSKRYVSSALMACGYGTALFPTVATNQQINKSTKEKRKDKKKKREKRQNKGKEKKKEKERENSTN